MNFTPDLEQIPHWLTLKKICKAQAVLDLLICGQEFETYHRYAPAIQEEYEGQEARIGFDFEEEDGSNSDFSRKIRADLFIDDRNIGGLPHWSTIYALINNGKTLEQHLIAQGTLPKPKRWWWPF